MKKSKKNKSVFYQSLTDVRQRVNFYFQRAAKGKKLSDYSGIIISATAEFYTADGEPFDVTVNRGYSLKGKSIKEAEEAVAFAILSQAARQAGGSGIYSDEFTDFVVTFTKKAQGKKESKAEKLRNKLNSERNKIRELEEKLKKYEKIGEPDEVTKTKKPKKKKVIDSVPEKPKKVTVPRETLEKIKDKSGNFRIKGKFASEKKITQKVSEAAKYKDKAGNYRFKGKFISLKDLINKI